MGAAATYNKIRNWLHEKGIHASQMGPVWSLWRYAAHNPEEAYPLYRVWYFEKASSISGMETIQNPNATFQDFLEDLQYRIARAGDSILSRGAYKRFCQKYNLAE